MPVVLSARQNVGPDCEHPPGRPCSGGERKRGIIAAGVWAWRTCRSEHPSQGQLKGGAGEAPPPPLKPDAPMMHQVGAGGRAEKAPSSPLKQDAPMMHQAGDKGGAEEAPPPSP